MDSYQLTALTILTILNTGLLFAGRIDPTKSLTISAILVIISFVSYVQSKRRFYRCLDEYRELTHERHPLDYRKD